MKPMHCFTKSVNLIIAASIIAMSLNIPAANATMVGSDAAIDHATVQQEPSLAQDSVNREAVKAKLLTLGVDPIQVQARVDALSVTEAQKLAQNLDQLPAGGGTVTILLVILLLLILL
jgi:hypothetical protein